MNRSVLLGLLLLPRIALASWPGDGLVVCSAESNQFETAAVRDGAGGMIVVWTDLRPGAPGVYAQHVLSSGMNDPAWPVNGVAICLAPGTKRRLVAAEDGAGGAIAAWEDLRSGTTQLFAQRVTNSATVAPGWSQDGIALTIPGGQQMYPQVVADGDGGAIFAWHGGPLFSSMDIWSQHLRSSGERAPGWPVEGRTLCAGPASQLGVRLLADRAGGAYAAWDDDRAGTIDIYVQHVLGSGDPAPGWPVNGISVCAPPRGQGNPALAEDGSGGLFVAWDDDRRGVDGSGGCCAQYDIYAQHVLSSATVDPGWPVNGLALATTFGNEVVPQIIPDGKGGAFVTWYDTHVFATRVTAAGVLAAGWPVNGLPLSAAPGWQIEPEIVSDGSDGAFITWYDGRVDGVYTLYAQHVGPAGVVGATPNGDLVSKAGSYDREASIVADGQGGVLAAWSSSRGQPTDIFAQRIAPSAALDVPAPGPGGLALAVPSPNPFQSEVTLAFDLPARGETDLSIFDAAGRKVRVLVHGVQDPGTHPVVWDGRDGSGRDAPAGVYFGRLEFAGSVQVSRMARVR